MAIYDSNGGLYLPAGSIDQFDPNNPEFSLFNDYDAEMIRIGGSPCFYYELMLQRNTIDPLYREDRGKIFSINPVQLYGYYEPVPSQNYMNTFGMDAPDEIKIELNYQAVLKAIGHPPKLGSRIFTPHKSENWTIVQRSLGEFKLWGELRLILMVQRFQESTTTGEGKVTQRQTGFKLNEGSLLG